MSLENTKEHLTENEIPKQQGQSTIQEQILAAKKQQTEKEDIGRLAEKLVKESLEMVLFRQKVFDGQKQQARYTEEGLQHEVVMGLATYVELMEELQKEGQEKARRGEIILRVQNSFVQGNPEEAFEILKEMN